MFLSKILIKVRNNLLILFSFVWIVRAILHSLHTHRSHYLIGNSFSVCGNSKSLESSLEPIEVPTAVD